MEGIHREIASVAAAVAVASEDTVRSVDCTCWEAIERNLGPLAVDCTGPEETSAIPYYSLAAALSVAPERVPLEVREPGAAVGRLKLVRCEARSERPGAAGPTSAASWRSAGVLPVENQLAVVGAPHCYYSTRKDFGWAEALEHVLAEASGRLREGERPSEEHPSGVVHEPAVVLQEVLRRSPGQLLVLWTGEAPNAEEVRCVLLDVVDFGAARPREEAPQRDRRPEVHPWEVFRSEVDR